MVPDKTIYRLLSDLSHFKSEAEGDSRLSDAVSKVDELSSDLKSHVGGDSAPDKKSGFDKAAEKTKSDFPFSKKDDAKQE